MAAQLPALLYHLILVLPVDSYTTCIASKNLSSKLYIVQLKIGNKVLE